MDPDSAHHEKWKIIELFIGIPIGLSIVLQILFTIEIAQNGILNYLMIISGCFVVLIGLIIITQTRRELSKYRQPTDPGQSTTKIISSGPFAFSRNPLNLGALVFYLGLGLILRNAWFLVCFIPAGILCGSVLIAPEEKYLRAKFGKTYEEYAQSIRRWVGKY